METNNIYQDIATRTDGDIYVGVVGPVRTGKSTFIKKFMETVVIPNIDSDFRRERATDELPQSSGGKTIMTTEPKFIPEEAVNINIDNEANFNVRLIDCVGYIVPSSIGYFENDMPRMVVTPWYDKEIPFNMAAEVGTQKVITEHSTIGLVITTDGSISDIPRDEYEEAEERVINELKSINKPFIVLLNCVDPQSDHAQNMALKLSNKYGVTVMPINCLDLNEDDIKSILGKILYEFPVKEVRIDIPKWILCLEKDHWLKSALFKSVKQSATNVSKIKDTQNMCNDIITCEYANCAKISDVDMGSGIVSINIDVPKELFYKILGETTGLQISNDAELMPCILNLAKLKKEYEKLTTAIAEVNATGYGIVMPTMEELTLEEPQIVKQGGKYGVKLRASAPSIHMMRADITAEVSPIVGSEKQSEDLVKYLLTEFEENPIKIWESNIFGKSLHELVNEGLHNKLYKMPIDARQKIQETIERVINDGCSGLVCIIL